MRPGQQSAPGTQPKPVRGKSLSSAGPALARPARNKCKTRMRGYSMPRVRSTWHGIRSSRSLFGAPALAPQGRDQQCWSISTPETATAVGQRPDGSQPLRPESGPDSDTRLGVPGPGNGTSGRHRRLLDGLGAQGRTRRACGAPASVRGSRTFRRASLQIGCSVATGRGRMMNPMDPAQRLQRQGPLSVVRASGRGGPRIGSTAGPGQRKGVPSFRRCRKPAAVSRRSSCAAHSTARVLSEDSRCCPRWCSRALEPSSRGPRPPGRSKTIHL